MSAMPSPAQTELAGALLPIKTSVDGPAVHPAGLKAGWSPSKRPSLGKRALLALARFLITFCIGVAATLAWQFYGDEVGETIAKSFPQLGRLAPRTAPVSQIAPEMITQPAPADPSADQQQLNATSLDRDAVRQSVDRLATGQEQITRGFAQLTAGQEQMTREITKLQSVVQYLLYKSAEPPPRPVRPPASKSTPRPPQAPTTH